MVEGENSVAETGGLLRMGHHHERERRFAHFKEELHDLGARELVEVAGGLVGQHDLGMAHQRARQGHALLFAARQFGGKVVVAARKAHFREQVLCTRAGGLDLHGAGHRGQQDVLDDVEFRHQVETLEHEADLRRAKTVSAARGAEALEQGFAVQPHIAGGKAVAYGAKVIPEGGFYAMPKPYAPGALIVGDGAGLLDGLRIKGIHIAIQSGIAAADAIAAGGDVGEGYFERLKKTRGYREVKRVKNVHGGFTYGAPFGVAMAGLAWATFGAFPFWMFGRRHRDSETLKPLASRKEEKKLPTVGADRLTDVFMSGTIHEENQPCHLKLRDAAKCAECERRFGSPCTRFCPAEVYRLDDGELRIDFSNCLHCKTCKVKCPFENIDWTFPQGGDGPRYTRM